MEQVKKLKKVHFKVGKNVLTFIALGFILALVIISCISYRCEVGYTYWNSFFEYYEFYYYYEHTTVLMQAEATTIVAYALTPIAIVMSILRTVFNRKPFYFLSLFTIFGVSGCMLASGIIALDSYPYPVSDAIPLLTIIFSGIVLIILIVLLLLGIATLIRDYVDSKSGEAELNSNRSSIEMNDSIKALDLLLKEKIITIDEYDKKYSLILSKRKKASHKEVFCRQCGKKIFDDDMYCPYCNQPTGIKSGVDRRKKVSKQSINNEVKVLKQEGPVGALGKTVKVFLLIGAIINYIYIIPICWVLPMHIHYTKCMKNGIKLTTSFKVCTMLFFSTIAGILMLCDNKN